MSHPDTGKPADQDQQAAAAIVADPAAQAFLASHGVVKAQASSVRPFESETTSLSAYGLTVEGTLDSIVIYGKRVDVTIDCSHAGIVAAMQVLPRLMSSARAGNTMTPDGDQVALAHALAACVVLDALSVLSTRTDLPQRIEVKPTTSVANPFA